MWNGNELNNRGWEIQAGIWVEYLGILVYRRGYKGILGEKYVKKLYRFQLRKHLVTSEIETEITFRNKGSIILDTPNFKFIKQPKLQKVQLRVRSINLIFTYFV